MYGVSLRLPQREVQTVVTLEDSFSTLTQSYLSIWRDISREMHIIPYGWDLEVRCKRCSWFATNSEFLVAVIYSHLWIVHDIAIEWD